MEEKITQLMTQVADLQKLHRNQAVKKEYATDRTSIMEKRITDLTAQVAEVKSKRRENDRASITEKKITELTAQVAELKSRSLNSVASSFLLPPSWLSGTFNSLLKTCLLSYFVSCSQCYRAHYQHRHRMYFQGRSRRVQWMNLPGASSFWFSWFRFWSVSISKPDVNGVSIPPQFLIYTGNFDRTYYIGPHDRHDTW